MGYRLLFLVIGFLSTALGYWLWKDGDKPKGSENVEEIKTGLWYMGFGFIIMGLAVWRIVANIVE